MLFVVSYEQDKFSFFLDTRLLASVVARFMYHKK